MRIVRLHHAQITIPKNAEAEARKFYCGMLGLPEIEKPESLKMRGGFWLQAGDRQVHVGVEEKPNNAMTKAHLAYEVDDLHSWHQKLEEEGFQILEGEPIPGFIRIESRDPFGNRFELIQSM